MVQIGLLGAGFIGKTHAAAYANLPDVTLAAVADANRSAAEALAAQVGARACGSLEELLADDRIAAVDICVPTHLHESCVVQTAARGKHILCEKPLTLSLESADRMIAAVEKGGVHAMVAQVIRFWPQYIQIRETFQGGGLGRPLVVTALRAAEPPGWGEWFKDPAKSGGALFDLHIHDLDFVYSLFGMPRSAFAVGMRGATGGWDHVLTSLSYADMKAVVEASYLMPRGFPFQMAFRLSGEKGCADFRFRVATQVHERAQALSELVVYRDGQLPEYPEVRHEDGYLAEIRYFSRCLEENRRPQVATLAQAREVLTIALAAKKSLETGEVVTL